MSEVAVELFEVSSRRDSSKDSVGPNRLVASRFRLETHRLTSRVPEALEARLWDGPKWGVLGLGLGERGRDGSRGGGVGSGGPRVPDDDLVRGTRPGRGGPGSRGVESCREPLHQYGPVSGTKDLSCESRRGSVSETPPPGTLTGVGRVRGPWR